MTDKKVKWEGDKIVVYIETPLIECNQADIDVVIAQVQSEYATKTADLDEIIAQLNAGKSLPKP